ncbi:ABC transporter ATP-binding protein [bacterium 1XD21-13]|nr:ABC transporter ATP-binding protein [bacterium 1XD21-13]
MELTIDRLTKQYKNKIAVDRVSLQFKPGVCGLLGANGAGKTTLMRMICGVLKPTGGTISFQGMDVSTEEYRRSLGYLPQDFGYYPNFTGLEFLDYMALLKGLPGSTAKRRSQELLDLVGLKNEGKKKIKTYSGGMKQRLGIAQAMLNRPKLLVLDEPTAGLDPKERVRFRELIEELGRENIVLLSTHIVSDIEQAADRILMMREGQMIFDGAQKDVEGRLEDFYLEQFGEGEETDA